MPYLNFRLDFSTLTENQVRITATSPLGETQVDVPFPFTEADLDSWLVALTPTGGGRTRSQMTQAARDFGAALFNFAIGNHPEIRALYSASLDRAQQTATYEGLRLRITTQGALLKKIPWEFTRDPQRDFLALSRITPIVHYTTTLSSRNPPNITLPLRALVMLSNPEGVEPIDIETEWANLQAATADLTQRGLLVLERMDHASLLALQRKLRKETYHIFHFVGHSDYNANTKQSYLVFEDDADPTRMRIITGEDLGRELGEEITLRLVVMNSCHSAEQPERDALQGIASGLVMRGIPAVIAMQFAITDRAANAFSEELYRAIADNLPVEAAVSEGRRAISHRLQNNEWATPVLFLRGDHSRLFDVTPSTTIAKVPAPVSSPLHWIRIAGPVLMILFLGVILFAVLRENSLEPTPTNTPLLPTETTPIDLPDLAITNARIYPSAIAPGQIFRLTITISNLGTADSGPFTYTWDSSFPTELESIVQQVDNIPPGASKNVFFPFSYGWWGVYNTQIFVDINSVVHESNEVNNRRTLAVTVSEDPFLVSFDLLPNNDLSEIGQLVDSAMFERWNMRFSLADSVACPNLQFDALEDSFFIRSADTNPEACRAQPLNIILFNEPVRTASIQLIPQAGAYTVNYYANLEKTILIDTETISAENNFAFSVTNSVETSATIHVIEIIPPADQAVWLEGLTFTRAE